MTTKGPQLKLDRAFLELHAGDDLVLVDVDEIKAIVGDTNSTVFFGRAGEILTVDESPREVIGLIHEMYVKATAPRQGGVLAQERRSDDEVALGYPRPKWK